MNGEKYSVSVEGEDVLHHLASNTITVGSQGASGVTVKTQVTEQSWQSIYIFTSQPTILPAPTIINYANSGRPIRSLMMGVYFIPIELTPFTVL